jgi:hypothetical protein
MVMVSTAVMAPLANSVIWGHWDLASLLSGIPGPAVFLHRPGRFVF